MEGGGFAISTMGLIVDARRALAYNEADEVRTG